jgi:riboflavin kinase / FMN adenylyltransferase
VALKVSRDLEQLPGATLGRAVTIGKFDGVHLGHQAVIRELQRVAEDREVTVVTFDRHPRELLSPEHAPLSLTSVEQKIELLGQAGADRVAIIPFTPDFAELDHDTFTRHILIEGLGAEVVLVGHDFRYGHLGEGSVATLRASGTAGGFSVHVCADVEEADGQRISSTRIRALLADGDVTSVTRMLGRHHSVRSVVVSGHQRGRELGYPTANLANPVEGFVPADGVYASWLVVDGERFVAATSIGTNPTFADVDHRVIESHAIGARLELYGKTVEVEFVDYIRPMNKFPDMEALSRQMDADAQAISDLLRS